MAMVWLLPAKLQKKWDLHKISDLLRSDLELQFSLTHEFINREDGWNALRAFYGLPNYSIRGFDHQLGYKALIADKAQVKDIYTTDAKIKSERLVVLEDDQGFFPDYSAVILFRKSLPSKVKEILRSFEGSIDVNRIRELNQIAEDRKNPKIAAHKFWGQSEDSKSDVKERSLQLLGLMIEHLFLVLVSLFFAILPGFPLGLLGARGGHTHTMIMAIGGVFQTIPSLALLALLIPIFGITKWTAIFALFVYSIIPIVRSTSVGLKSIPDHYKTAVQAMGLPKHVQLFKVYVPMALPNIMTGVKTSTIWNIGTAHR